MSNESGPRIVYIVLFIHHRSIESIFTYALTRSNGRFGDSPARYISRVHRIQCPLFDTTYATHLERHMNAISMICKRRISVEEAWLSFKKWLAVLFYVPRGTISLYICPLQLPLLNKGSLRTADAFIPNLF